MVGRQRRWILFGDLIAYGIGHGHGPLSPWKYMFITFGGFTVLWSAVLLLFLPDSPWKMKFLNEREKKIAVLRVMSNHTGISASHWKWKQALSVLVDPQAWIFFCIAFIQCLPGGGLTAVSIIAPMIQLFCTSNLPINVFSPLIYAASFTFEHPPSSTIILLIIKVMACILIVI